MILKHAIRYLELTGSDFITDLKDFAAVSYTHLLLTHYQLPITLQIMSLMKMML